MSNYTITTKATGEAKAVTKSELIDIMERECIDRDRKESPEDFEGMSEEDIYMPDIGRHVDLESELMDIEAIETDLYIIARIV
jgi:hypothetical protein